MSTNTAIRRPRINANGKRIPRQPRPVSLDTITIAKTGAGIVTKAEIEKTLAPMRASMQAMREGRGQRLDFEWLCTACHIGQAVEDSGVVMGFETLIDRAYIALANIETRAIPDGNPEGWTPVTLYAAEINALTDWTDFFGQQIGFLSWREYTAAYDKAIARVTSGGGKCLDPKESAMQT